jgi:hypothetical protein
MLYFAISKGQRTYWMWQGVELLLSMLRHEQREQRCERQTRFSKAFDARLAKRFE